MSVTTLDQTALGNGEISKQQNLGHCLWAQFLPNFSRLAPSLSSRATLLGHALGTITAQPSACTDQRGTGLRLEAYSLGISNSMGSLDGPHSSVVTNSPKSRQGHYTPYHLSGKYPPGLLQHVLTVLVFWSWVLLLSQLPPWSRSLRFFPWASILLCGPLDIAWICCPQLPHHPCKMGRTAHVFYSTGGAHAELNAERLPLLIPQTILVW